MKEVVFKVEYGDSIWQVEISDVTGASGLIHLYINRYWIGYLNKRNGEWELQANKPNKLTSDDIQILGSMFEEMQSP